MVDCGSDQGRSEVETAGVAALRRGFRPSENAELGRKMPFMDGHDLESLSVDDIVQVSGHLDAFGVIWATYISFVNNAEYYTVIGYIENIDKKTMMFNINNLLVDFSYQPPESFYIDYSPVISDDQTVFINFQDDEINDTRVIATGTRLIRKNG